MSHARHPRKTHSEIFSTRRRKSRALAPLFAAGRVKSPARESPMSTPGRAVLRPRAPTTNQEGSERPRGDYTDGAVRPGEIFTLCR